MSENRECSSGPIVYSPAFTVAKDLQYPGGLGTGPVPEFPATVEERLPWDFDRLIHEVKWMLEAGETAQDAGSFIQGPQLVRVNGQLRELGVIIEQLEWLYGEVDHKTVVTGIIISGCMLRVRDPGGVDFDQAVPARNCEDASHKVNEAANRGEKGGDPKPLISSSSSSSSSWGSTSSTSMWASL